ncbi:hypothetical protein [Pseudoalteromonas sp. S16_S37]|uniref:hypothetical protein n=1 Tax=Pseudoalteromonas sp. S16_S37 TaxID=2720228 RepID=UPI0016816EC0|nr:hypothetical protein [Pseudoalteromonas sp. S16_S37]MBD1583397.1 hypothetical protein [Pseudoalteromonas sp. S16_S37]
MFRIIFWLFLTLSANVWSQPYRTEYYADFHFWESPYQPFIGTTPLSKEDAQKRIHIQAGYDRYNRLVEIKTKLGKHYKNIPSLYVHAVHTQITYQDSFEIHRFFDSFGNQVTVWGDVWEQRYQKDGKGRYLSLKFFNKDNEAIENSWGVAAYHWSHPGDGSVVETRVNQSGELKPHRPGFEFERIRLLFDGRGNLRLMQNLDEQHNLLASASGAAQYRYFYNARQGFERWEVLDKQGKAALGPTGTAGEQYTFDKNNWTQIAFFGVNGQPAIHDSGAVHWHAQYDQYGNLTERWFTDAQGQPINGKYGFHKRVSVWDTTGLKLLRHEYYDNNNQLTRNIDGVAKVHFIYNMQGLLIEMRNTDEHDTLVNDTWNGYARQTFTYDEKHVQKGSQRYLAKGEVYQPAAR